MYVVKAGEGFGVFVGSEIVGIAEEGSLSL
jgi:hypothetical protein